jgi:SET domain-containing protein
MKLEIKRDPRKGRGVYAVGRIPAGRIIERCQYILLKASEISESLDGYVFAYTRGRIAVALGYGSLYNHDDHPNAQCYFDDETKELVFEALRAIGPGEEITISYGYTEAEKKRFGIR